MQKKLIALAVAGLAAVPAIAADSSVTLYGLLDMGYSWRGSNYIDGMKSRSGFDSGQLSGTRLGVKGMEELSPGFKAIFTVEAGIFADTGSSQPNGLAWGRQAFAGFDVQGTTITLGRQYTPAFNMYATYEPFGLGSVAQTNNIFTHIVARADNSLNVSTPFFGDIFAVEANYSLNESGQETGQDKAIQDTLGIKADKRYASIFPKLHYGPATLMAGYTQEKVKGGQNSNTFIDVGLNLDFKVAQIFGAYARVNYGTDDFGNAYRVTVDSLGYLNDDPNGQKLKFNRWFLGGKVPLGNFNLLASYAYSKDKNDANMKAQQFGLGGTYAFSKRTDVYAVFSRIIASDGTKRNLDIYEPQVGDATNSGDGYRSGVQLGMRHTF
ncbi:MAG: porin [Betaproteobacteria bacterium]|nr:porin [Betaproteobacteria bacterium]